MNLKCLINKDNDKTNKVQRGASDRMRYIVWTIISSICKHSWEYEEVDAEQNNIYGIKTKEGIKVSATCKKCGWHRKYWKHA